MKIETATVVDIERLVPLGNTWYETCNKEKFGIVIEKPAFYAGLEDMINDKNEDVLILVHEGKVVGCLGITKFKSPLSKAQIANEHFLYVMEKHRAGRGSHLLLGAARQWAINKGCTHLILNASRLAGSSFERVCNLYKRLNFQEFEKSFICQLKNKNILRNL